MPDYADIKNLLSKTVPQEKVASDEITLELTEAHLEKIASLVFDKIKADTVKYVEEKTAEQEADVYERLCAGNQVNQEHLISDWRIDYVGA